MKIEYDEECKACGGSGVYEGHVREMELESYALLAKELGVIR